MTQTAARRRSPFTLISARLVAFLAVLGPSGSGKSSLVRAGLVPALRRGGLPGSGSWTIRLQTNLN